jgi:hypothetical protein
MGKIKSNVCSESKGVLRRLAREVRPSDGYQLALRWDQFSEPLPDAEALPETESDPGECCASTEPRALPEALR